MKTYTQEALFKIENETFSKFSADIAKSLINMEERLNIFLEKQHKINEIQEKDNASHREKKMNVNFF